MQSTLQGCRHGPGAHQTMHISLLEHMSFLRHEKKKRIFHLRGKNQIIEKCMACSFIVEQKY